MSSFLCSRNKIKDGDEQIIRGGFGGGGAAAPAAMRKGPWTEEEDAQLVRFVRLFGERRWDFLAKVSGLRRTGKSCRLRWVNYLHPDLRRGRITADEERLIVQLHAQWGSRWSRIARSIPGRTDNEIKNFWRTRTRKHKAALQAERPRGKTAAAGAASPMSSVTTVSYCCPGSPNSRASDDSALREGGSASGGADGEELEEASTAAGAAASQHDQPPEYCCAMDQLWNEIAEADAAAAAAAGYLLDGWGAGHCYYGGGAAAEPPSPVWEYCQDFSLWRIDDEEYFKEMLDAS